MRTVLLVSAIINGECGQKKLSRSYNETQSFVPAASPPKGKRGEKNYGNLSPSQQFHNITVSRIFAAALNVYAVLYSNTEISMVQPIHHVHRSIISGSSCPSCVCGGCSQPRWGSGVGGCG